MDQELKQIEELLAEESFLKYCGRDEDETVYWYYPAGSGADFFCEGSPGNWVDVFSHTGPAGNGWSWKWVSSFSDAINASSVSSVDGKKIVEFSIKRSVLGTLKNFVNFSFVSYRV